MPVQQITWFHVHGLNYSEIKSTTNASRLTLSGVKPDELNNFKCVVLTHDNQKIQSTFTVKNESNKNQDFKVKITPVHLDVRQGGKIELLCEAGWFLFFSPSNYLLKFKL